MSVFERLERRLLSIRYSLGCFHFQQRVVYPSLGLSGVGLCCKSLGSVRQDSSEVEALHRALLSMNANSLEESQSRRYKIILRMYQAWISHQDSQKASSRRSGRQSSQNSMLELVTDRRGLGVSDPRDMIFVHVGFASDGKKRGLEVDYSKTCEQVYVDFALFVRSKTGWATLLETVDDPQSQLRLKNLPSWISDWTVPFLSPIKFPRAQSLPSGTPILLGPKAILTRTFEIISYVSPELRPAQIQSDLGQRITSRLLDRSLSLDDRYVHVGKWR
jgi:hypothetical protein